LKWSEIAFLIVVSGFVIYEILSEWPVSKNIVMAIPKWLNQSLNIEGSAAGTIKALVLFVVIPLIFYFVLALAKRFVANESWKSGFSQMLLAILPITASMHLLKALFKTTSRIPYWKFVFHDPEGVDTATEIIQKPELLQSTFLTVTISPIISIIAVILPILGLVLSFYIIKKQPHKNRISIAISILAAIIYSSIFIVTMLVWKVV